MYNLPPEGDCGTYFAGTILVRAIGIDTAGIDRKIHLGECIKIPDCTVNDDACKSPEFTVINHQLTENGAIVHTSCVNYNDFPGHGHIHCLMEHQIITLVNLYGKCSAQKFCFIHRADILVYCCQAVHAVINICHRQILKAFY